MPHNENIELVANIINSSKTLDEAITRLHTEDFQLEGILVSDPRPTGGSQYYVEDIVETLDDFEREIRKRENNENTDYGGERVREIQGVNLNLPEFIPERINYSIRELEIRQR